MNSCEIAWGIWPGDRFHVREDQHGPCGWIRVLSWVAGEIHCSGLVTCLIVLSHLPTCFKWSTYMPTCHLHIVMLQNNLRITLQTFLLPLEPRLSYEDFCNASMNVLRCFSAVDGNPEIPMCLCLHLKLTFEATVDDCNDVAIFSVFLSFSLNALISFFIFFFFRFPSLRVLNSH